MGDRLSGLSLTEADFLSMLQGFVSDGNVKKQVDVEVKGAKESTKEIEKFTEAVEKLNSIKTSNLSKQLETISTLLSVRFKGVNLNQFTSKLIQAFQDPTKNAEELANVINDVYANLTTLASVSRSGSFIGFSESEIRKTISKQQKILELKEQFEAEDKTARATARSGKPVDILTRARVEKIQKKSSSEVAMSLGVDSSKIDVRNGDDTLLQNYQQTADLLAKMVSEKKEFNKLNKANVGDYLKQEQDILSVFRQLQDIEKQISEKFGISSKDFLSNQFKGDNGQFDFVKNAEQAVKTYVTTMTSSTKKALQEAQTKLSEQLNTAATKSVDRLGTANEEVNKTSERLGGSRANPSDSTTVQAGAKIGESVAVGMEKAEAATDAAAESIKKYILSAEETINKLNELKIEIEDLDTVVNDTDDPKAVKQLDEKYGEAAKYVANLKRLGYSDEKIDSVLGKDIYDQYWRESIDTMAPKNTKEVTDAIKKYVSDTPIEVKIDPVIESQEEIDQISQLGEHEIAVEVKTDGIQNAIKELDKMQEKTDHELGVFFDTKSGQAGEIFKGEQSRQISASEIKKGSEDYQKRYGKYGDTLYHTHPEAKYAALSDTDITTAVQKVKEGLVYIIAQAGDQIAQLNVKSLVDSGIDTKSLVTDMKLFKADYLNDYKTERISQLKYSDLELGDNWKAEFEQSFSELMQSSTVQLINGEDFNFSDGMKGVAQKLINSIINQLESNIQNDTKLGSDDFISKLVPEIENRVREELISVIQSENPNFDTNLVENIANEVISSIYREVAILEDSPGYIKASKARIDESQVAAHNGLIDALKKQGINPDTVYKHQSRDEYVRSIYSPSKDQQPIIDNNQLEQSKQLIQQLQNQITSLREELQRFKDTGVEPEGIADLQAKLEDAERRINSLSNALYDQTYETINISEYNRLEEELEEARNDAVLLKEELDKLKNANIGNTNTNIFAEQAKKELEETQQYFEKLMSIVNKQDPNGVISKYLLGENGIKSSQQLMQEIKQESDAIFKSLSDDLNNGITINNDDYIKALQEPFKKMKASWAFGLVDYDFMKDTPFGQLFNQWYKQPGSWAQYDELNDDHFSFYGGLIDAQERLNILQKNGGQDYITHLERVKQLQEEVQTAKERNATFKKTDIDTTELTSEQAKEKADNLLREKQALDELITSVEQYRKESSVFENIDSWFGHYLPDVSGLKTISNMLEEEADNLKSIDILRNNKQASIFEQSMDYKFGGKKNAPKELENYYEELYDSFFPKSGAAQFTGAEAIDLLNQKAKELGVTFDETSKKWIQLSSSMSEASITSENTSTPDTSIQDETNAAESTIDAEMSKLDQLKNKIATEIPQAIGIKNNAFRDEQSVVESVIGAEVEALTKLEGGLKGVTDAAKNKTKAFQEQPTANDKQNTSKSNSKAKTSGGTKDTGTKKSDGNKEQTEQEKRDQADAAALAQYNSALSEYITLERQRVNLAKEGTVKQSAEQESKRLEYIRQMDSIQKQWNKTQSHSNELQEEFDQLINKRASKQQLFDTDYLANYNKYAKNITHYGARLTTIDTLLAERSQRPEAFSGAMDDLVEKGEELKKLFPLDPTNEKALEHAKNLSDEIQRMTKEIRANPEYKNATATGKEALSRKAEQWATNNSAALKADPAGFQKVREAIKGINDLSQQNEASRMLDEFIAKSNEAGKAGASFADTLKQRFKSLGAYLLSFASFYRVIGWVREAVQTITELDTAMVELKKVSDESAKSYSDFMKQSFDMADEVGTTSEQIIQSTADWKRLGRSFEESKKLAQQSTVLMNVSEFENINDATEAMVSATQAYTDVASEDIIDKLNHVGNNYAVGTSELATGLQNAAAVLKTQGNDIDEALALLTAGNLIGQDMSKASAGIRTISLRISGTEEAKDEIAEMGEDVDDFVVRTKSKTDQIIRDYTAVASNAHQGISVLDDNGNLRDTYSILLDISKIYKEIQEEDKKYGTNRAQALVETLAGKNRSNIASSILLNGDILESVYNASKNESKGSAQHELDTYLDSIEGKTAKLQNRLQELTSTAIDSEFIKTVIDGLTKILELANSLIDTFGLLPTVLSGIGSVLLQKSGNGLFNYNKTEKSWTFGFQKLIEKVTTNVKFPNDAMAKVFAQMDPNKVYSTQLSDLVSKGVVIPQEMYNTEAIEGYSAAVTTAGEAMEAYGVKTAGASGLLNNFNAIAGTVASTLLSMASSMIAMWAIGKLFSFIGSGIDSIVHKRENTIKGAEEAQQDIDDIINKNQARKDFNNNDEKYERLITLSSKVTTDENGYKNISATNEEYEEYISLCNEIAGIYPTVVSSYDAQGNAIVNLGDSAKETRGQIEALNKASLSREYTELKGSVNKTWAGNKLKLEDAKEAKKTAQAQVDANQETIDLLNESDKQNSKLMDELKKIQSEGGVDINTGSMNITEITALQNSIRDAAKKAGIDDNLLRIGGDVTNGIMSISSYGNYDEETWTKFYDEISINIPSAASDAESAILESDADLQAAISQGQQILQEQLNNSLELLTIDPKFLNLDEHKEIQEAIKNSFLGLTEEELPDTDNIEQWAIDNFIEPISYAFTSSKGEEAQNAISNLFKDGIENMSVGDYDKYLNHNLDTIKDFYKSIGREDLYESFIINFDFAFKTPDGSIIYNDKDALIRDIQDYLPDKLTDDDRTQLMALTWEQLINVHDLLNDDSFAGGLAEALKKATQKAVDIAPTDTLSTLINDESYKSSTESLSSDLSSLTGALETLRTEGSLTAEQMVELQNSFPDLTEFTTEAIQTKAFEKLDEWISKIREGMKGMSEEGKEQARTMIQNMVDQYGDLGVSVGDIMDSYVGSGGSASVFSNKFEKLKSDLAAEGLELDTHVLYTLVAQDEFSGTADQILEKYKDVKINWDLILESKELENDINRLQSQISNQQAKNSRKEANGGILNSGDYYDLITLSNGVASDRQIQYENTKRRYDNVKDNKYIDKAFKDNLYQQMVDAETEFINAQVEVANNEKSAIESQANGMLQVLKRRENDVTKAQNALTDAENKYGEGNAPEEFYSNLQDALYSRANVNTFLSHMYEAMAQANPKYRDEFMEQALSYSSSAQSDTESAKGYDNSDSQKKLNKLQEKATKIQRNLTVAEQNHQKVSKSTYNALIHNAKDQIKLLKEEQEGVKDNLSEWRNYQDQIDSLNDSIYEWGITSESLFYDQASQLASAISSAMSESISETGLTDDTINALKTAFSDLDGSKFDVSDAFYSTADGVKVNTEALQELTEAEFELIGAPLANEIANIQAQLEKDPGNSALQDKLENLMETNAKYFAQYEEMQKALSRNAAIDLAEGTENAGANYDKNYGRVKTYKEAYENGLTGTDDFKAWTSYLDVYGRDTLEAYESVSGKIDRYFTEDASEGLGNFLTDMEKLGYAAQDADGYWDLSVDDYNAAAKDMQMGSDWFMDTMRKLEDYGFIHTYVSSLNEAQLKTRDVEEQIADAVQTYSDMVARGASDEELQKQIEHINELESQWQELDTVTKTWDETTEANRRKEFLNLDDQLSAFEEMYKNADTDAGREAARKAAQDYVKQFRMTLNEEDLAKGVFKLSDESAEDYASRITEFSGSIENPLTAEDMGISEENVDRFETMRKDIQELAQSGDLANIQDSLSGITAEQLRSIDYDDGKYTEGFEAAEGAVDKLRKQLGLGVEDTDLLIDAMTALGLVVDQKVNLPTQFETLDNFLVNATKGSGAGYQISTDIFGQSAEQLQTQMDEIGTLELQIDPDSDVYEQLQELKKQTEIQLNIKNSEYTQEQLKEWAEAGDRQQIANTFGIDVDSEEVDQYIQQIKNTQLDYDMVIHVDDTQFAALMEAITGEPYEAKVDITADGSEAEEVAENTKKNIEKKPIIQTIQQKIQSIGNAITGFFGGGQQQQQDVQASAQLDTSKGEKELGKFNKDVSNINKTSGTATADINISTAMGKIAVLKDALNSLSGVRPMPIIDQTSINNAINRVNHLIERLNASKTAGSAIGTAFSIGTAHASGTTSLSRAYADGKDWTVGRDESALVNEIGQESIVRDGVWQLIPGGPHVEDLRKDDIVFNAEQTEDLIRTGKTARRGQLVAHANGTVSGMPAYSKRTKSGTSGGKIQKHSSSSDKKGNTGGGNGGNNGGNGKSSSNNKKQSEFEKWLEKLFDWIEVRLDRIQRRIDISTTKAENAIGKLDSKGQSLIGTISKNKNANINAAMRQIASNASEVSENNTYIKQKNGKVTSVKGGSANTLLGASVAGALRYQQQADQVAKVALNKNVFKSKNRKSKASQQKYMNNLISLIHSGAIDIKEYSGDVKKFIEAYKGWYDKSQDLVKSTEELRQQYKELQQTKLDNIVDEFETLVGLSEAVKASSEATVEYYKTAGRAVGTKDEEELENQRDRQGEITKILTSQISAFKGELVNAEKVFGKNSNEYREAQTKLEEMNKSLIESQTTELELAKQIRELSFTIRGHFITRVKAFVDKLGTIASLAEKRGTISVYGVPTRQTEDPYMEQTRYNNELILKYYEDIKDKQKEIQEFNWEVDSDQYEEAYNAITSDESAILSLLSANEDLKDSIRSLRWKPYEELNKELDDIVSDLQHVNSFIRDGEILDDDGQITKRGYAQIALIAEQMDVAEKKIRNANAAMKKLDEEYANNVISTEEYNEALDEQIKIIQDASSSLYDDQTKLADIYIDQITKENDILQDLIQSRKEALSAKKEYYDYDKTLRSKNKDIAQLQAQINALQGVTNDAAIAKRTKLQAELAEKQEDLQDTLYQHSIDLQQEGYDTLSEDMQQALDNAVKAINGDFKILQDTSALMLQQLKTNNVDEAEIIRGIVGENATTLHSSTNAVIDELSGEDGVKKLLEGLGVQLGDIAKLDIAKAINSRTPDTAVSNIDTVLSTVYNSLGEDVHGQLRAIELAIGAIKYDDTQKKAIEDEITELKGQLEQYKKEYKEASDYYNDLIRNVGHNSQIRDESNAFFSDLNDKISEAEKKLDELTTQLEESQTITVVVDGDTAKGNDNVGGDITNTSEPKIEEKIPPDNKRPLEENKQPPTPTLTAAEKQKINVTNAVNTYKKSSSIADYAKLLRFVSIPPSMSAMEQWTLLQKKLKDLKISATGIKRPPITATLHGYAKGTKNISKDLLAWTNEDWNKIGSEMIVRPSDGAILTPLKAKDSVIPANLADNLFKWGAISPDKFITNPFVGKWSAEGGGSVTNNADYTSTPQTVEMHFDSLFHIEGNVDESVMPRLENLGKSLVNDRDFQKNVIKFVTKDFVRESKKQGIR